MTNAFVSSRSTLIFDLTTRVYGVQGESVVDTLSYRQLCPQIPFAENNLKTEVLQVAMGKHEQLDFVKCRFGMLFFCVSRYALIGQLLTVWRTASNLRRPYLDVRDDLDALSYILGAQLFAGRICNVLTKNATVKTMRDIIIVHRPGVATRCVYAAFLLRLSYTIWSEPLKNLGFEFRGSLEQGIAETIELLKASSVGRASETPVTAVVRCAGLRAT